MQARKGKVQLIDATSFWSPMRKSLGDKRREIPLEREQDILKILADFRDGDSRAIAKDGKEQEVVVSHVFSTTHFGFRKITVERPLRLNFQASPERSARLEEEKAFQTLAQSKRKGAAGVKEQTEGRELQDAIRKLVQRLPNRVILDRAQFEDLLDRAANKAVSSYPALLARRCCLRCQSVTRRPLSAAARTGVLSLTLNCAIRRACTFRKRRSLFRS